MTERIRSEGYPTIMGNYDDGVGFDRDECGCAYKEPLDQQLGQQSLEWTKAHTTAENKAFLRTLVPQIRVRGGRQARAPRARQPAEDERVPVRGPRALELPAPALRHHRRTSSCSGTRMCPYTKDVDGVLFVNVGSVGKPKDGDPRSCYAMLDLTGDRRVTFRRVEYDVQAAAEAVRHSDLPDKFARDLERGGAPAGAAAVEAT